MNPRKSYTVHLSAKLWNESLVAGLGRLGHKVILLLDNADEIYISQYAWRIPQGIGQMKMTEHIETIMKQVRALEYADQTADQPEATDKKPRSAVARKPKAAKGAGIPDVAARPCPVDSGPAAVSAKPHSRKVKHEAKSSTQSDSSVKEEINTGC